MSDGLPREVCFALVVLQFVLLFVVALFTCTTHTFALRDLSESEVPAEQEQAGKEPVINQQARVHVRHSLPRMPLLVSERYGQMLSRQAAIAPQPGHRLPNNLMAPLRC